MPENVYHKLMEACNNADTIEMGGVGDSTALDWLTRNVEEGDCMEWEAEIEDITDLSEED